MPLVTILIASKRIFNGVEGHLDYSSNDESFSDRNVEESFTLRHNASGERPDKSVLEIAWYLERDVKVIGSSD